MAKHGRKIVAILAADVVGYSRLMSVDEEGTLVALKTRRAIFDRVVQEFGGTEFGSVGDSLMAQFASAVNALRCAQAIQQALGAENERLAPDRRMLLRIGINLGDVIEENGALFGDGVNVAARLQALAPPGGILVSGSLHEQVKNKVPARFRSAGVRHVKNMPDAILSYEVLDEEMPRRFDIAGMISRSMRRLASATIALLAILGAGVVLLIWTAYELAQSPSEEPPAAGSRADRGTADAPSIAVLPFVNMSAEPDNEPFADGLSEEVLNVLAGIQGLKVAGRTSSFYFKGRNEPASVMAAVLKVSHLLEGSVRKAGERVRITAQLVDAQSGYHLWSQTFDRELNDVFAVQEDIARAVASALKVQLLPEDDAHLAKRGTADAEAYRLYLLGRGRMRERSIGGLRAARTLFEQAIARDPNFAAAYAGLSDSYHLLMNNHREEMQDGEKQGTRAAARAIELDPHSSEAYASRANFERQRYQATGELSAKLAALADYRRAVELDPTNAQAYHWLGIALNDDDQAGAMEAYEKAVELDPLLRQAQLALAEALADQGRHEEAFDRVDEVVERFPDFANAYLQAAGLHGRLGHLGDALELTTRAYDLSAEFRIAIGAYALSVDLGDLEQAARWLERAGTNSVGAVARELARLGYQRDYAAQLPLLEQGAELGLYHETRLSIAVVRLILSRPEQAAQTIADGFAALVAGEDSINVLNCDAAIALTAAWQRTGRQADARRLLERTAAWFDGPSVPRYGDRWVARAAIHALLGERDQAFRALDRAFDEGYRGTWGFALGVVAPLIRGEDNPVFDNIRDDPRFSAWFERIRADNARQLAQWKARSGDATARSAGL